jgi:hypothetical protein
MWFDLLYAEPFIQNLAGDKYVTASQNAPEQNSGQFGTGHGRDVYFQFHVICQAVRGVTSGFGATDRGSIGRHSHYTGIVEIYISC